MAVSHQAYRSGESSLPSPALAVVEDFEPEDVDSDVSDEFTDANDEILECDTDFETQLRICEIALQKFFNNEFEEARKMLKPWAKTSMYHALGISIFEFIPAVLTFDATQIETASVALKRAIKLCKQQRRNNSLVRTLLRSQDYRSYTDIEAHAELIHGEALLLQAILSFIEDEDLTALIRGTFKIKSCYNSYKLANKILSHQKTWDSEICRQHFESGVKMGIGTFNLMISLLPSRIITLLEFVGFQGNKWEGLRLLEDGSESPGLRKQLCQLVLLSYHLIISHYNGKTGDLPASKKIIDSQIKLHPRGVWFLLFRGRLDFMKGHYSDAILNYHAAIDSQDEWKQIHHMCYWELMWLHSLQKEWRAASAYVSRLAADSVWSRTIYSYLCAAMLLQEGKLSETENNCCLEHIKNAPSHKQRIAGKSLPMEKFVIRRCQRFVAQDSHLLLPGLEMMCLWNVLETISGNSDVGHDILEMTQNTMYEMQSQVMEWENGFENDNRALLFYIHGCALRHVREYKLAVRALDRAIRYKDSIVEDHFLIPYATVEKAFCLFSMGDVDLGTQILNEAKTKYKGYSLESRLHFRIHNKLQEVADKRGATDPSSMGRY